MRIRPQTRWDTTRLRDLCERVDYGYTASASSEPVGPKFLRITDIVPELIEWESVPYCKMDDKDVERYRVRAGDIVIARTGATTGYAKRLRKHPESVFASYLVRVRIKPEHDAEYIGLVVESREYKKFIKANLGGAAQPQANAQVLTSFPVPIPPLKIQRRIGAILSAYDDLIENNHRRIMILEEMVRAIYREWFVELRAPDAKLRRATSGEKSVTGKNEFPDGWEVATVGEVASYISRGVSPKYDEDSSSSVINQRCIRDGRLSLDPVRKHSTIVPSEKIVRRGDVLVNSTGVGTLGRVAQVYEDIADCTADSHVSIVRGGGRVGVDYFGMMMMAHESHFEGLGIGATGQTELGREAIARTVAIVPPKGIQERFSEIVGALRRSAIVLGTKNGNLRRTRDLLLPKLVSGEISVKNLEIVAGAGPRPGEVSK